MLAPDPKPLSEYHARIFADNKAKPLLVESLSDDDLSIIADLEGGRSLAASQIKIFDEVIGELLDDEGTVVIDLGAAQPEQGSVEDYPIPVKCFAGVFWVHPLEEERLGYFDSAEDARRWAEWNWDHVRGQDDELST